MNFLELNPTQEDYWRAIILFGKNVASYKFALAQSLLELKVKGHTFVTLEELAIPYSKYLTQHLQEEDRQTTSKSSKFLDSCRAYNTAVIPYDELIAKTVKLGFANVIDAFHNVNYGELPLRFFIDHRREKKGITLTDDLFLLDSSNLSGEVEGRWRLVETAWRLKLSRNLLHVNYDDERQLLFTTSSSSRKDVTSIRDAISGYQKGKCFYCFTDISIISGSPILADVDHFFPHKLGDIISPINGVWNLVLSCQHCNRGTGGKFDQLPSHYLLERLHKRNEFYINSHHPLKETLKAQTGGATQARINFLSANYLTASTGTLINSSWKPMFEHPSVF